MDVTVMGPAEGVDESVASASTAHPSVPTSHQPGLSDFVSAKQLKELDDKLDERFMTFEALLLRGNIFLHRKIQVSPAKQLQCLTSPSLTSHQPQPLVQ